MNLNNFFNSTKASKKRKILICICFFIPSIVLMLIFTLGLAMIDYEHDPSHGIGLLIWGSWSTLCGIYLKNNKFKIAGVVLLILSFSSIVLKLT
jgi:hypothetical protein